MPSEDDSPPSLSSTTTTPSPVTILTTYPASGQLLRTNSDQDRTPSTNGALIEHFAHLGVSAQDNNGCAQEVTSETRWTNGALQADNHIEDARVVDLLEEAVRSFLAAHLGFPRRPGLSLTRNAPLSQNVTNGQQRLSSRPPHAIPSVSVVAETVDPLAHSQSSTSYFHPVTFTEEDHEILERLRNGYKVPSTNGVQEQHSGAHTSNRDRFPTRFSLTPGESSSHNISSETSKGKNRVFMVKPKQRAPKVVITNLVKEVTKDSEEEDDPSNPRPKSPAKRASEEDRVQSGMALAELLIKPVRKLEYSDFENRMYCLPYKYDLLLRVRKQLWSELASVVITLRHPNKINEVVMFRKKKESAYNRSGYLQTPPPAPTEEEALVLESRRIREFSNGVVETEVRFHFNACSFHFDKQRFVLHVDFKKTIFNEATHQIELLTVHSLLSKEFYTFARKNDNCKRKGSAPFQRVSSTSFIQKEQEGDQASPADFCKKRRQDSATTHQSNNNNNSSSSSNSQSPLNNNNNSYSSN